MVKNIEYFEDIPDNNDALVEKYKELLEHYRLRWEIIEAQAEKIVELTSIGFFLNSRIPWKGPKRTGWFTEPLKTYIEDLETKVDGNNT
jgi:hypothetical protein